MTPTRARNVAALGPLVREVLAPAVALSTLTALTIAAFVAVLVTLFSASSAHAQEGEAAAASEATLGELVGKAPGAPGGLVRFELARTSYVVDVAGTVVSATLEQEFVNGSHAVLEASYLFPLPDGAAVHQFELRIGDRVLEGVVREKEEARREFAEARDAGQRASLVEQHRPNAFTTRVTNVQPGEAVVVKLSFAFTAAFEDGRYRLRLPLTSAERFRGGGDTEPVPDCPRLDAHLLKRKRRLEVELVLDSSRPAVSVTSPTHQVLKSTRSGSIVVQLARADEVADRDLVLEYVLAGGAGAYLSPEKNGWRQALTLLSPPEKAPEEDVRPKEVLFIVDTSGSMSDGSMDAAKSALDWCLSQLRADDLFGIAEYDDDFSLLSPSPMEATPEAVASSRRWVKALQADGGTMLLPALHATLALQPSRDHHRVVIVLTDGHLGDEAEVVTSLEKWLGDARLFVIGIGSAPNGHLVSKMAAAGRGLSATLSPGQDVEQGVAKLFARIASPLLWDVSLHVRGAEVGDTYPARVPDLYAGLPVSVLTSIRAKGPFEIDVTGESVNGARSFTVKVDPTTSIEHEAVATLWARARVEELEDELRRLGPTPPAGEDPDEWEADRDLARGDLVRVALDHGLVSSATSFVVVDTETVSPGETPEQRQVAVAQPAAWPGTASSRPRVLALGLALLGFGLLRMGAGVVQLYVSGRIGLR